MHEVAGKKTCRAEKIRNYQKSDLTNRSEQKIANRMRFFKKYTLQYFDVFDFEVSFFHKVIQNRKR